MIHTIEGVFQIVHSTTREPAAVAESVEHRPRVWEVTGSNPWSNQINDL